MISSFRFTLSCGFNVYVLEIRTNFILKKTSASSDTEGLLKVGLSFRLKEYWMSDDEIQKLVREALCLAKQQESITSTRARVIPFVVGIDVCTVQQEGEGLDAAMDRAIKVENLLPLDLLDGSNPDIAIDLNLEDFLICHLPRIRVEDVDEGFSLMETCSICLRNPTIGAQVSVVPSCRHAFHYHCIVRWVMRNNSCPLCRVAFKERKKGGL
ncbi:nep1-interacting protein-like 1 [Phtheirospermum japonicum]|uniref:Nep1-interacting protein-like 1 n=1 Tax=Phtheirospermum japonicum TaxID=374723 RepID=A0A830DIY8_9LAMI|nr:nep1-interacting protein-like 1 [Phtheirospermum japonicum]